MDQDDWNSYVKFTPTVTKELQVRLQSCQATAALDGRVSSVLAGLQVVGDDLTVTNPKKIKEAAEKGWVGKDQTRPMRLR